MTYYLVLLNLHLKINIIKNLMLSVCYW